MNKKGMLSRLIGAFVAILIGVSMLPVISKQVTEASSSIMVNDSSPTATWGSTMLKLTPAFFALAILGIGFAMVAGALRSAGLLSGGRRSRYEEPTEKKNKAEEMEKKYHYDFAGEETESKSGLQMSEEDYTEKKKTYEEKMRKFREKKGLNEKELEVNL